MNKYWVALFEVNKVFSFIHFLYLMYFIFTWSFGDINPWINSLGFIIHPLSIWWTNFERKNNEEEADAFWLVVWEYIKKGSKQIRKLVYTSVIIICVIVVGEEYCIASCSDCHIVAPRTKVTEIGRVGNGPPSSDYDTWGKIYEACIDNRLFVMVEGKFEVSIVQVFDGGRALRCN